MSLWLYGFYLASPSGWRRITWGRGDIVRLVGAGSGESRGPLIDSESPGLVSPQDAVVEGKYHKTT